MITEEVMNLGGAGRGGVMEMQFSCMLSKKKFKFKNQQRNSEVGTPRPLTQHSAS